MNTTLKRYLPFITVGALLLLLVGIIGVAVTPGSKSKTITVEFAEAPGLYPGNHVEVLGIEVGTITSIKPGPDYVTVKLSVRASLPIPADADAELMAPEAISDRFVQLSPPYTGGPTMLAGATIPTSRTAIPQSVDAEVAALNELAQELGPNQANKHGALTNLVHELAAQLSPSSSGFHSSVVNLSKTIGGLGQEAPQVQGLLDNLGSLSQALADNSSTYSSLTYNLNAVSQILAGDRSDIAQVLNSLQQLFADLTSFIEADGSKLGASITNLDTFAAALGSQQAALAQAYDLAPLAVENLDNAIDKTAPGGPALIGRYDPVAATSALFNTVCGNSSVRFLVVLATGIETNPITTAGPEDTLCAIGNALNALTPPPGATHGPNLSLSALVP